MKIASVETYPTAENRARTRNTSPPTSRRIGFFGGGVLRLPFFRPLEAAALFVRLPPEAEVLSFARQAGGYGEAFAVMPEDCRRLTCGETVYLVTDTPVAPEAQGAYLGVLARSCVFDADTGRELTRAELEHIEPVPGPLSAQRRESRVYGAVYALEGTDSGSAVAVEVDGALLRAEAERRAPGAS